MVHQDKPYGSVGLIFLHHAPGKWAFVHHPLRGGFSVRAGAPLQRAGKALESPNKARLYSWALNFSILQSHRIPY